ncbi:MAG: tRNA threonylcarbamoyladenosine dehydratase [Candidatus Aegiribacteria sp.]|nr:tRNA threonylcarbamoyladenosine dehydratase [Candidatus Aegiribacteria sp.]
MQIQRRFDRVVDFFGRDSFLAFRRANVAVIGLGGVGCHAAAALARSGIGILRLVDFDKLTETSLNRNPMAGLRDCGSYKVDIVADQIRRTCPDTRVETITEFFHLDTADSILKPFPDVVIDAIDSLNPKAALLEYCVEETIPVFSSMGASGRRDPSHLRRDDISQTRCCPLAKQLRKYLRKRGITSGIPCVYSTESAGDSSFPPDMNDLIIQRGRVRNRISSLMIMPGIFGYALAGMVLDHLATGKEEL